LGKEKMKKIIISILAIILLSMSVLAVTINGVDYYSKSDFKSRLQETFVGESLQCSQYPTGNNLFAMNLQDGVLISSKLVTCPSDGYLINIYTSTSKNSAGNWIWQNVGEYQSPVTFTQLSVFKNYMWECYSCPAGSFCNNQGQKQYIDYDSYATCTLSTYAGYVKYWKQTVCPSGYFANSVTFTCDKEQATCVPDWKVTSWSQCINNQQTRSVTDLNNCGVNTGKPSNSQSCTSPECQINSDCQAGYECKDSKCIKIIIPECINEGRTICDANNAISVCRTQKWILEKQCTGNQTCGTKQGETAVSCIDPVVPDQDYTIAIIIGVAFLLAFIIVIVVMSKKKRK
jgi:hypothetical protein